MCQLSTKKWGVMCLYQPDQLWYFQVEYNRSKKFPTIFFKLKVDLTCLFYGKSYYFWISTIPYSNILSAAMQ